MVTSLRVTSRIALRTADGWRSRRRIVPPTSAIDSMRTKLVAVLLGEGGQANKFGAAVGELAAVRIDQRHAERAVGAPRHEQEVDLAVAGRTPGEGGRRPPATLRWHATSPASGAVRVLVGLLRLADRSD